jgi:D-amino-acid dehydrogenase
MKKNVTVIGGGVIGLFSAYYLAKSGLQVSIIDKGDMKSNCSFGNAGMIVPSHIIPLAAPGMIAQGVKWMFHSKSPFYIRPRIDRELIEWGIKFYKSANKKHVERSMPALRDISFFSKHLYRELSTELNLFDYEEKGLLMLYQTEKVGMEERHVGEMAQKLGIEVDFLDQEGVSNLETGQKVHALGGVYFHSDAHLYPNKLMLFLQKELQRMDVEFHANTAVQSIELRNGRLSRLVTNHGIVESDTYVIAGGTWSSELAKMIDEKLRVLPGKGYSFTLSSPPSRPKIPAILCEGKVAVTPMGEDIRFGGTMEITHTDDVRINMNRVEGIVKSINSFYPEMHLQTPPRTEIWKGFRPCSPTGLPYICRSKTYPNLIYATGHGMMGLSLAPATGKLVNELIIGQKTSISLDQFGV